MALIKCSECGKEISDKAGKCIHCGNRVRSNNVGSNSFFDLNKISFYSSFVAAVCFGIYTLYITFNMIDTNFYNAMHILVNFLNNFGFVALSVSLLWFFKKK